MVSSRCCLQDVSFGNARRVTNGEQITAATRSDTVTCFIRQKWRELPMEVDCHCTCRDSVIIYDRDQLAQQAPGSMCKLIAATDNDWIPTGTITIDLHLILWGRLGPRCPHSIKCRSIVIEIMRGGHQINYVTSSRCPKGLGAPSGTQVIDLMDSTQNRNTKMTFRYLQNGRGPLKIKCGVRRISTRSSSWPGLPLIGRVRQLLSL